MLRRSCSSSSISRERSSDVAEADAVSTMSSTSVSILAGSVIGEPEMEDEGEEENGELLAGLGSSSTLFTETVGMPSVRFGGLFFVAMYVVIRQIQC